MEIYGSLSLRRRDDDDFDQQLFEVDCLLLPRITVPGMLARASRLVRWVAAVASLLPDTPAYRSGLDAGDVIECVDGIPTKDMSLICAVKKITGPKGSTVTLNIRRGGKEAQTMTLTRDKIVVPTIRGWQRTVAVSGCRSGGWEGRFAPQRMP